ncbi:MAG: Rv3654c family TadE-like protein [Jatrophihabitantaceae bacterium]
MTLLPRDERGSASIWVLGCGALVIAVALAATLRGFAVLARHRAESAADLAALAAAARIGIASDACASAARVAAANGAAIQACVPSLATDGRSGAVLIRLRLRIELPVVGVRDVTASARAGREAVPP